MMVLTKKALQNVLKQTKACSNRILTADQILPNVLNGPNCAG